MPMLCRPGKQFLRRKYMPPNKGFSLIELVAAVCVIGIIAAISMPIFIGLQESAADESVKKTLITAFKECKIQFAGNKNIPKYTVMMQLIAVNGYYTFYQSYRYVRREDGYIPTVKVGNCNGPIGEVTLRIKKIKGTNKGGELSIGLKSGRRSQCGGLSW